MVGLVLASATRTFLLPRSARDKITRQVFVAVRMVFNLKLRKVTTYEERDSIMAVYAPVALLMLPVVWMATVLLGYMLMYWATGVEPMINAFRLSGSSLLTLGFQTSDSVGEMILMFSEAVLGLTLIALLIAYLPTIYSSFSKREQTVSMLEVRAGSPPSPAEMFKRMKRIDRFDELPVLWDVWEVWFTELDETHTSLAVLPFFRSPQAHRSWITAAGAVLDSAALYLAALDLPKDSHAPLTIRAGYIALRHIADYFGIPYNANPKPDDPISVSRVEFDAVLDDLIAAGIPVHTNRDQVWKDFVGWRVNYDTVLLALAALFMAPYAPWSSDRSLRIDPRMKRRVRRIFQTPNAATVIAPTSENS
ncbi:MAG: hypothetical protein KF716_17840 [Anaerolineae bacterium]|nr:hypothetical protein [Anaerolineae bacterium]